MSHSIVWKSLSNTRPFFCSSTFCTRSVFKKETLWNIKGLCSADKWRFNFYRCLAHCFKFKFKSHPKNSTLAAHQNPMLSLVLLQSVINVCGCQGVVFLLKFCICAWQLACLSNLSELEVTDRWKKSEQFEPHLNDCKRLKKIIHWLMLHSISIYKIWPISTNWMKNDDTHRHTC